jgi:hypothetical protein
MAVARMMKTKRVSPDAGPVSGHRGLEHHGVRDNGDCVLQGRQQAGGGHNGTCIDIGIKRFEKDACQDDVKQAEKQQRAVKTAGIIDQREKRCQVAQDLSMGAEDKSLLRVGRALQVSADEQKQDVVGGDASDDNDDGHDCRLQLQAMRGPCTQSGADNGDPAQSDEPTDPFAQFAAEKNLLCHQFVGQSHRVLISRQPVG